MPLRRTIGDWQGGGREHRVNVRDGADSSYAVLQRLVLGYDEVDVYPDAVTISSRGTRWVTIALAMPPGTPASAERRCGWAATQFLSYDS
ncbi:MAG: hypothetical protein R2710_18520 [Acidimicrobiales bacterium]